MRSASLLLTLGLFFVIGCKKDDASRPTTSSSSSATPVASSAASPATSAAVLPRHSGPKKDHPPAETKLAIAGSEPSADEPPPPK